jgi:hypothetical protein
VGWLLLVCLLNVALGHCHKRVRSQAKDVPDRCRSRVAALSVDACRSIQAASNVRPRPTQAGPLQAPAAWGAGWAQGPARGCSGHACMHGSEGWLCRGCACTIVHTQRTPLVLCCFHSVYVTDACEAGRSWRVVSRAESCVMQRQRLCAGSATSKVSRGCSAQGGSAAAPMGPYRDHCCAAGWAGGRDWAGSGLGCARLGRGMCCRWCSLGAWLLFSTCSCSRSFKCVHAQIWCCCAAACTTIWSYQYVHRLFSTVYLQSVLLQVDVLHCEGPPLVGVGGGQPMRPPGMIIRGRGTCCSGYTAAVVADGPL